MPAQLINHTIVNGDSRNMKDVGNESVDLIVTSPPYWQLKDYNIKNQIGFNDTYEEYVNNLNLVWNECFRVLKPGTRLCINIGDQFARKEYYGRYKIMPIHSEIIKFCEIKGFDFMGQIIWQKVTTMNTSGGACIMGSYPYPKNGIVKLDFEYILLFKKPGIAKKPTLEQKEKSKMTSIEWNKYFYGHWNFPGTKQDKHLAMFPLELPHRLIKMFSFVEEIVLDPFLGSGTTSLAANNNKRNSIGYEINPDFIPIINNKIKSDDLFVKSVITNLIRSIKTAPKYNALPYKFKDLHAINNIIDIKSKNFGNRIDGFEKIKQINNN